MFDAIHDALAASAAAREGHDTIRIETKLCEYLAGGRDRESSSIHVSNLWYECARKEFLIRKAIAAGRMDVVARGPLEYMLMDVGASIHLLMQNAYLRDAGILWGDWGCPICGPTSFPSRLVVPDDEASLVPDDHAVIIADTVSRELPRNTILTCPRCGGLVPVRNLVYVEKRLRLPLVDGEEGKETSLSGRVDGFVDLNGEIVPFELKTTSVSSVRWAAKNGPRAAHVEQINTYLGMLGKSWGVIFYLSANPIMMHEARIDFSDELYAESVTKAKAIVAFNHNPVLTDRICDKPKCDRSRFCPVAEVCFNDFMVGELTANDE